VRVSGHGGEIGLAALRRFGVGELFTLSGGHVFPFYDAAVSAGTRIVDVRHEQTAVFAAEATAKLTRRPGVAVLTAGPGVTNGVSATASAQANGAPLVVLGGRAPEARWGSGSLQEFDHVPIYDSITKRSATVRSIDTVGRSTYEAAELALTPHRGPVFLDYPLDVLFAAGEDEIPDRPWPVGPTPDPDDIARVAALLARAVRPALVVGSDVYWDGAWEALRALVETQRVPTFANGLGRGLLAADHELAASRTRGLLRSEADLVVVVGTPLDFRLSFGQFGDAAVVHVVDHPDRLAGHVALAGSVAGDLTAVLTGLADAAGPAVDREDWVRRVADAEATAAAAEEAAMDVGGEPIKPARIYRELRAVLDRDAVVVCDGGDFVSYAGKYLPSYEPGRWLDAGPFGCLGTGMGYLAAARLAHPSTQVVGVFGDGAIGFSLADVDTLVRHGLPAVMVVGNNGCWGLEKHPMRLLYGYDVAADLQEACPYDQVVAALGGAGETVTRPEDIRPALERALAADAPYLVNVITDPEDVYPRSSNLG
jgi:acetolactate synthase I/II/III large subunit